MFYKTGEKGSQKIKQSVRCVFNKQKMSIMALYITKEEKRFEPWLKSIHSLFLYEKNKAVTQIIYWFPCFFKNKNQQNSCSVKSYLSTRTWKLVWFYCQKRTTMKQMGKDAQKQQWNSQTLWKPTRELPTLWIQKAKIGIKRIIALKFAKNLPSNDVCLENPSVWTLLCFWLKTCFPRHFLR